MSLIEIDDQKRRRREADRKSYLKHREKRIQRARQWRKENPDKLREIKRRWDANNPEKLREQRRRKKPRSLEKAREASRKHLYGVTSEMFETMLVEQNHSCKICGKKPRPGRTLTVDHCHETGQVRGLLCTACNVAIGQLGDNEAGLLRALNYVQGGGT